MKKISNNFQINTKVTSTSYDNYDLGLKKTGHKCLIRFYPCEESKVNTKRVDLFHTCYVEGSLSVG